MKKIGLIVALAGLCACITTPTKEIFIVKGEAVETFYEESLENMRVSEANALQIKAKAAYLMDFHTKTPLFSQNERTHLPIASMCKIMTLLLAFDAIDEGTILMDEDISVSERAASMGGSQVFLEAHAKYPVKELIKSIVVCSANDSCVAMAERIAGGESLFVEKMNEKAKLLGANDTLFSNCTGLPKEPQYSCAKDVAIMLSALLKHEQYFEFGKVWMDKFAHPKGRYTEITNTNKLIRYYDGCDGGKTGFTNEAGFCLAATALRGEMRVISVVIGEETSANRFDDTRTLFDYAFCNYSMQPVLSTEMPLEENCKVRGGKQEEVLIYPKRNVYALTKRGEKSNYTIEKRLYLVKAPVKKGETIGEAILFKDGIEVDRVELCAATDIQRATVFDGVKKIAKEWNK